MKKQLFCIFSLAIISTSAFAQHNSRHSYKDQTPPSTVTTAFQQQFTSAPSSSWKKSYTGKWLASFDQDSSQVQVEYDSSGAWIATRTSYANNNLPGNIDSLVHNKYPSAVIKNGEKIQRSDVAAFYKVKIEDNGTEKDLLMNDSGTIIE